MLGHQDYAQNQAQEAAEEVAQDAIVFVDPREERFSALERRRRAGTGKGDCGGRGWRDAVLHDGVGRLRGEVLVFVLLLELHVILVIIHRKGLHGVLRRDGVGRVFLVGEVGRDWFVVANRKVEGICKKSICILMHPENT